MPLRVMKVDDKVNTAAKPHQAIYSYAQKDLTCCLRLHLART